CADVAPPRFEARVAAPAAAPIPLDPAPPTPPAACEPPTVQSDQAARWPAWLRARVQGLFDGLACRLSAAGSWLSRWRALHEFGVAFDPLAPFEVRIAGDRLELRLAPRAGRAERVRGNSIYLMQPGSAIVVARGGRLLSHAGDVELRARAR
ncbi:MAG: hypothetical protein RL112_2091, partial [Planctomycetota bacterium]